MFYTNTLYQYIYVIYISFFFKFFPCDSCLLSFCLSISCECALGFTGKNCSENVDDCKSHACLNGASCVDGLDAYSCMCSPGFSGHFCEIAPVLDLPLLLNVHDSTPACLRHQCQNNAVCYQSAGSADYMCKCAQGTAGHEKTQ